MARALSPSQFTSWHKSLPFMHASKKQNSIFISFVIVLDINSSHFISTYFQLFVSLLLVLAASLCVAGGSSHRHVLIHVPVHVKHHHHTHTIYKHIKHQPEYKVLGYELGGHGHGWSGGGGGFGGFSGGSSGGFGGGGYGGFDSHDLSGGYSSWGAPEVGSYESNHYGGGEWEDDKWDWNRELNNWNSSLEIMCPFGVVMLLNILFRCWKFMRHTSPQFSEAFHCCLFIDAEHCGRSVNVGSYKSYR